MQMNANQLTKIPVEKLSDALQFLIAENEIPLSDALKQVIDDVDAICKKLLRDESAPAQPVIPEQPEHSRQHFETLCNQFWNWAEFDEINQDEEPRLEWNGSNYTNRVTAALWKMYQAAPAQPVSEPYKLPVTPEGWKLVPIEPTAAMFHAFNDCDYGRKSMRERYIQMIESAPAQEGE